MNEKRLELIEEIINSVQRDLNLHIADTDKEIGDIQNLRMEVAGLREAVNELRKSMDRHADKVTNRFAQVIEPVITSADNLAETIDKKRTIVLPELKRSFWKFWQKGG